MSSEDTIYNLRIVQAAELPLAKNKQLPNAYVEVNLTGFKDKTQVIKRNRDPCWNKDIQL
jgi:hypothetical protein